MPRSTKKRNDLGGLKHWIAVCNWFEVPDDDVNLIRERDVIFQDWAQRNPYRFISKSQTGMFDHYQANLQNEPTHEFIIRTPHDVLITARHWVFEYGEHRGTWYRVLSPMRPADNSGCYSSLLVQLDEVMDDRADPAVLKTPDEECFDAPDEDEPIELEVCEDKPKGKRKTKSKKNMPAPAPRANRQTWGGYSI